MYPLHSHILSHSSLYLPNSGESFCLNASGSILHPVDEPFSRKPSCGITSFLLHEHNARSREVAFFPSAVPNLPGAGAFLSRTHPPE